MKKKTTARTPTASKRRTPAKAKTIARTLAEHESDPRHRFHARGQKSDGRVSVAAGERLQRVRSRASAN
jgi:hypothetical protein